MAAKFVEDLDQHTWQNAFCSYQSVLQSKAEKKSKKSAKDDLLRLDKWYQEDLPVSISERSRKNLSHDDLVRLVKWKLSRGKFRPRLEQLAQSNPSEEVEKLSEQAYKVVNKQKSLGSIKKAIELLSKLKGIGPATASAILAAGCPDQAAFMSDEPALLALQASGLKYNLTEYMTYVEVVRDLAARLHQDDVAFGWTPRKVETAMWTHQVAAMLGVQLATQSTPVTAKNKTPSGKRRVQNKTDTGGKKQKR